MGNFFTRLFGKSATINTNVQPIINNAGDVFYPLNLFYDQSARVRTDYDFNKAHDREMARKVCTPLAGVLDKLGDMLSRCELYVTDNKGNERRALQPVRDLLQHPNPLQDFGAFFKQLEAELRLHGYVLVKLVRGLPSALPKSMWIVPTELVRLRGTGKVWEQDNFDGVVQSVGAYWHDGERYFEKYEVCLITNGGVFVPMQRDDLLQFIPASASLSYPVNNWIAAMAASHTLLVNGGAKGIISGEGADGYGQTAVSKVDEEDIRKQFKAKYGLVGKQFPILVTRHALKWQPMDFNAQQLRIDENDEHCTAKICNTFGINPNLFSDAKYDNQESAKKAAYQDVIIPDSLKICSALEQALLPQGGKIAFDYSAVECLQNDRSAEASTLNTAADAINKLLASGLITEQEARTKLADYLDIDPAMPVGKQEQPTEQAEEETDNEQDNEQANE